MMVMHYASRGGQPAARPTAVFIRAMQATQVANEGIARGLAHYYLPSSSHLPLAADALDIAVDQGR
jgi:hypothetical protein